MPLMTPYISGSTPNSGWGPEWAPPDFVLVSLFSSAHCTSLASLPWLLLFRRSPHSTLHRSMRMQRSPHLCGNLKHGNSGADGSDFLLRMVGRGLPICPLTFRWDQGPIAPSMTSLIKYSCFGFSFSWSLALVPCAQLLNKPPSHKSLNQASASEWRRLACQQ